MRRRKRALSLVLAILLVAEATQLPWPLLKENLNSEETVLSVTRAILALYLVLISAFAVPREHDCHWRAVLHLSALTAIAAFLLGILGLISDQQPPTPPSENNLSQSLFTPPWFSSVPVVLWTIACGLAATIPRGPRLYFPPEKIYFDKTGTSTITTPKNLGNVCEILCASVLERLFFVYINQVIRASNAAQTLQIGDLPIVPVDMRASYIFATMRAATRNWKLRIGLWRPKPGSGWELSYRLIRLNLVPIFQVTISSAAAALMYYMPPLLLQQFVSYLEADPGRERRSWGWLLSAGLFLARLSSQTRKSLQPRNLFITYSFGSYEQPLGGLGDNTPKPSTYSIGHSLIREDTCPKGRGFFLEHVF